jgi:hypothetical protein
LKFSLGTRFMRKVGLKPCLTNYHLRHEGIWEKSTCSATILDISFTHRPLYSLGQTPIPISLWLSGPQSRCRCCGREGISYLDRKWRTERLVVACLHTDRAIWARTEWRQEGKRLRRLWVTKHGLNMKDAVFWDVTPCGSVLRLLVTANVVPSKLNHVTLMMVAIRSSGTSFLTRATRRNIPADDIFPYHRRENLKSYTDLTYMR